MVTRKERWEEGILKEFGTDMYVHTVIFRMDNQHGLAI